MLVGCIVLRGCCVAGLAAEGDPAQAVPSAGTDNGVHGQPQTQQAMSQVTREHRQEQKRGRDELWCRAKVLPGDRGNDRAWR